MRTWIRLLTLNFLFFVALRLTFLIYFHEQTDGLGSLDIFQAFYLGMKFDLRLALGLLVPLILLGKIPFLNPVRSEVAKTGWGFFYLVTSSIWLAFYFVDFGYFEYLNARFNSTALHFLKNPVISAQMVWQTYPVIKGALLFLAFLFVHSLLVKKWVFKKVEEETSSVPFKTAFIRSLAFFIFFVFGVYGKFSYYPLRWSEAFAHSNHFAAALGLNPVLYFFDTLKFKNTEPGLDKVRSHYDSFAKYLGVDRIEDLNFSREVKAQKTWPTPPNVILIVMESLASHRTSLMNSPLDPTPHLNEIAKQSYFFDEYYVPSEGTARSIFSLVTGVPDVSTVKTASRNPFFVDQKIVLNTLKGHNKFYMIGGSANWANIRAVFANNIDGLEIVEEGQFSEPRTDVWGLSDYHLFKEALTKVDKQTKPFFAFIQAASFHRPFTIPEDRGGFLEKTASDEDLKKAGFESLAEYNSLRFTDYALGYFFKEFKKSPHYKNTIFVITGDHGLPENQADFFPEKRRFYQMEKFHVPLVIHNPQLFPEPVKDSKPAGEVDVITTLASLAGVDHMASTLGRDLFDMDLDDERYAFTYTYYNPTRPFSLIGREFIFMSDQLGQSRLYQRNSDSPMKDVKMMYPEKFKRMQEIAKGYLYSAEHLLRNNRKPKN